MFVFDNFYQQFLKYATLILCKLVFSIYLLQSSLIVDKFYNLLLHFILLHKSSRSYFEFAESNIYLCISYCLAQLVIFGIFSNYSTTALLYFDINQLCP